MVMLRRIVNGERDHDVLVKAVDLIVVEIGTDIEVRR